jgi:hypothetical protein
MEYYALIKRNELSSHENRWRKFKCMFLSEICFHYNILEKSKLERWKMISITRDWGK